MIHIGYSVMLFEKNGKLLSCSYTPAVAEITNHVLVEKFKELEIQNSIPIAIRQAGEKIVEDFLDRKGYDPIPDWEKYFLDSEFGEIKRYRDESIKSCVVRYILRDR